MKRVENARVTATDLGVLEKIADVLQVEPGFIIVRAPDAKDSNDPDRALPGRGPRAARERGGDNLTFAFSPALVDEFIFVIDVPEVDKIPRKRGPAVLHSHLLVINKTDLAPRFVRGWPHPCGASERAARVFGATHISPSTRRCD